MSDSQAFQKMLVGPIKRFNQRNEVLRRARYDPEMMPWMEKFRDREMKLGKPGFSQLDYSLTDASWYIEDHFAMGNLGSNNDGLYAWGGLDTDVNNSPKVDLTLEEATASVKKAATFFGAGLVGVCAINPLWLYSHNVNDLTGETTALEFPESFRYAVVMAVEMDYDFIQTSPAGGSAAATGLGYSKMALISGLLAQFIRGLGYGAFPSGNDTALSIPLAIEAGLGEIGRNGLLITSKFGPRIRLCKVFTDLPLVPDSPKFFGVEKFCELCKKCAQTCPSQAITFGGKTSEAITISNNPGVEKWMINPEQCFRFWGSNRTDCSNCIRSCPFNQKSGWIHDAARFFIKNFPWFNPVLIWLHGILHYDKQTDPTEIWK
jgi:epoxyqueuosine reductase